MTQRNRGLILLAVQLVLVLSIVGKYVYERKVCPRVWVRTAQVDPGLPFRGKYLALRLAVDSCALPRGEKGFVRGIGPGGSGERSWRVRLEAKDDKLVAVLAGDKVKPELTEELTLWGNQSCNSATLRDPADYFIGDRAKSPFPLKPKEELWVEVTVPPSGPPRPIQLAISGESGFRPLVVR
jgi:hypothetical protein